MLDDTNSAFDTKTKEDIETLRNNPKCINCIRYKSQSTLLDIKGKKGIGLGDISLRIYQNSAEKLEQAKGYCCVMISEGKHTKTMIKVPELSLCSDHRIHHDIETYITTLSEILTELENNRRRILRIQEDELKVKQKAQITIEKYNKKYNITGRPGRPKKVSLPSNQA